VWVTKKGGRFFQNSSNRFIRSTSCSRPRIAVAQSHPVPSYPIQSHPLHKNTRVFECKVVSEFQSNQWRTFGDLRFWTNEHLHFYLYR
jgi:hypothetical protein